MSMVIGSSFIKSGADNTVILLGVCGTKSVSEFGNGSVDDSSYVKKQSEEQQSIDRKFVRVDSEDSLENIQTYQQIAKVEAQDGFVQTQGKNQQMTERHLRKGREPDDVSKKEEDYITRGYVESKYVVMWGEQQIIGTKSFYDNVTAN
ncbi:MAG: hypothetical protein EZS28_006152 [Streblomastix strix]|uniref:Uncharacterized protein n=1 Tax=Streblomastix strix TaxID=222440 RepID=A0A5J4WUR4_9EUKA|nr:MAG: hypothetical protein EZS28_006152 [Streblomastix strix]